MSRGPWPHPPTTGLLKIGEAATLTGVSQGRIRHYQARGLLDPPRSVSGYRYFRAPDLVRLLQIDLLRSLGMGLQDIDRSLPGQLEGEALLAALRRHQVSLRAERDRLGRVLAAIDQAVAAKDASAESVAALLASVHSTPRDSLGIFGRLRRPLSEQAATVFSDLLGGGWGLPVPSIFGRILLPSGVTDLLERLAAADGHAELFARVRALAATILSLTQSPSDGTAKPRSLAHEWLDRLAEEPLPTEVQEALDQTIPRIRELAVLNQGFRIWAGSISPPAAEVLQALHEAAWERGLVVLGVLVARPRPRRRARRPI
ncbi:MAG: MerR family transcriptional regulator [Candidatus Dormibacteria bacterium]